MRGCQVLFWIGAVILVLVVGGSVLSLFNGSSSSERPSVPRAVDSSQKWFDADSRLDPHLRAYTQAYVIGNASKANEEKQQVISECKPLYGLPHGTSETEKLVRNSCASVGYPLP